MNSITPIRSSLTFLGENKKKKDDYKDPLIQWPARGLAYTNELGAAISEVAPKMGTLLWFPAMLYFGADIYDKYKNQKTSYNPDAKRATNQAIFQLLASVLLPTAAVIAGQKTASVLGIAGKNGVSLQTQEEIVNFIQDFSSRRHLRKFENNIEGFKEHFEDAILTKRDKLTRAHKTKNPLKLIGEYIFERRHPDAIAMSQKERVLKFADKQIDEMFDMYGEMVQNKKPNHLSNKLWNKFEKLKIKLAKDPEYKTTYLSEAAEEIIKKYQKSKIMNNKMLKTIGGFIALGLAIKPIDNFVENVIIKKVVKPNLDNIFTKRQTDNFKEKNLK